MIQARAVRGIAVGEFFPQEQGINAGYSSLRINSNDPPFDSFQTAGLGFDAAWELDFWGKFRRNIHAEDAALLASIADYDDVLVTLVAEVGLTYVQIRTFERRIELAKAKFLHSLPVFSDTDKGDAAIDIKIVALDRHF